MKARLISIYRHGRLHKDIKRSIARAERKQIKQQIKGEINE